MKREGAPPGSAQWGPWAAIVAIAATYFYFLIFAEFAFLELARGIAGTAGTLRLIMAALGIGGVSGAVGAALLFREQGARCLLTWAFRACAAAALLALTPASVVSLGAVAFLAGASLGGLTVLLASTLRNALGPSRLGLGIGAGTGLAYAACNLPWIFHATPVVQTWLGAGLAGAASFLPRFFCRETPDTPLPAADSRGRVTRWTLALLALVWLDSAAFYIVQHTAVLRAETWSETSTLLANAGIHLLAALVAGQLIDRGWRAGVTGLALLALAFAALILNGLLPRIGSANLFYTAGVSLYSVVLVEFPARDGRPGVAALVFAVAGWIGSALGIGMAQDLAEIPTAFVISAVLVVVLTLPWRSTVVVRMAPLIVLLLGTVRGADVGDGRQVYVAEGCIHCHSQFIRPRVTRDVINWGPTTPLDTALAATPPLFGNRRQGPDLSHVGNRRSPEWNRLHLISPSAVSPGSRMPSYRYLFGPGDARGDALVVYLATLGSETMELRQQQIAQWRPEFSPHLGAEPTATLFQRLCSPCHGHTGRGDGPLAAQLILRPPDWQAASWRRVAPGEDPDVTLSRIIKFGLPGTAMAGHEYLPDAEIVGLARHVQILHQSNRNGQSAAVQK